MKVNSVQAMIIASLVIILLYILGLFLPIIKNTKNSKIFELFITQDKSLQVKLVIGRNFSERKSTAIK